MPPRDSYYRMYERCIKHLDYYQGADDLSPLLGNANVIVDGHIALLPVMLTTISELADIEARKARPEIPLHHCPLWKCVRFIARSQNPVRREPEGSTARYSRWINSTTREQLYTQIYTSNGPTVVMPTWLCHKSIFDKVGGFDEGGKGVPEDYIFFLKHLKLGGELLRVDEVLLMYRHHPEATTASVSESTIWKLRLSAIQDRVLKRWEHFTIWNAGKQGRKFYRELSEENRKKVSAFCDVDPKKIEKGVYIFENSPLKVKPRIPIVHFTKAIKPFIICMKLDLTGGEFEKNLESLNLIEGIDYFHFN